ncbi:MAG: hypothetical protein ICV83_28840 [Cytophagales bacterium]|nr:hypothetical protein [Cytophagales bacterium]
MTILLYVFTGLLAVLLTAQEWRRPDRRRLAGRVAAVLLAAAALALLAARPSYRVALNPQAAVLLTPGAPADSLRALLAALPGETSVWTTDSSRAGNFAGTPVQWVSGPGELRRRRPGLRTVHLLGHGLPGHQLAPLDSIRVVPHLTPPVAGLAASWTEQVALGEPLVVQGEYRNATGGAVQLRLAGFGRGLDSVTVAPGATARFALRATPKEPGPFVFHLESAAGTRRLGAEKIPFEVSPKRLLNVLFLESFPTFGGKFLKAFLSEAGHRVAARTAISKGKFRTEFLNAPPAALGRLTPTLLAGLDLVILDNASLRDLGGAESTLLRGAIRDGLGVLVGASGGKLPGHAPFTAFRLAAVPGPEERRLAPRWSGGPADVPPVAFPSLAVENAPAVRPLVASGKDGTLAAFAPFGLGGVTVAVTGNAFEWVLAGRAPVYASYWSHLLTATARRREAPEGWRVATPLPVPDVPATLQLVSADPQRPEPAVDSTMVYPQQTTAGLGGWESTFWPRREGWHAAKTAGGAPFRWYVFGSNDWPGLQARHRYDATLAYLAEGNAVDPVATPAVPVTRRETVPPVWFYALFLLGVGYLWLERKL